MAKTFGYADVGSFGLAHSLLAWARCRLWCDAGGVPMLAPSWLRLRHRIGPIIRRERDIRQYQRLFHFPGYISGLQRMYLLATLKRVSAEDGLDAYADSDADRLVVFRNRLSLNEETYFHEIVGHSSRVRSALVEITKPQYRPTAVTTPHIALHVRFGDFRDVGSPSALRQGLKNARLPIDWYRDMLDRVRNHVGNVPARVYSDGGDKELAPLLAMPNVIRSQAQQAVTDLLAIAHSQLLIASGSGFSIWGAYLGELPRICFPGQRFVRVLAESEEVDLEPECEDPARLDPRFLDLVRTRIRRLAAR
jgi:hypothetical protein